MISDNFHQKTYNFIQKQEVEYIFTLPLSGEICQYLDIIGNDILYTAGQLRFFFWKNLMAIIELSLTGMENARLMVLGEKNIRFIAAKSLTQTAQAVQEGVKEHIRKDFVLRKQSFPNSVKVRPATKENLQASIFTMAGFATIQQTGGKQTAKSGRLAVPRYNSLHEVKSGRKTNQAGSFLIKLDGGGVAIAGRPNGEFRILYYLKNLAYMPKRLKMLELGEQISVRQFPIIFQKNLGSFDG